MQYLPLIERDKKTDEGLMDFGEKM